MTKIKKCPKCNTENPTEANFCRICGWMFDDADANINANAAIKEECNSLRSKVKILQQELLIEAYRKKSSPSTSIKISNRKLHVTYTLLLILFTILGGFIGGILQSANSNNYSSEYYNLSEFIDEYSKYKPFDIVGIDIKNEGQEYGADIYSKNTTYINPRICIAGLESGSYTFQVKFYNRYGDLSQGENSPTNYSYEEECYINGNEIQYHEFSGWGAKEQGNWEAGNYRIEIWYKNNKIAQKHFQIYNGGDGYGNSNDSIL